MNTYDFLRLQARLTETTVEHAKLDGAIALMAECNPAAELEIKRLKKRKLFLKEEIYRLKSVLSHDIIA